MNTDELIEHVTNDLIAAIENGADTWHMPWHTIATNAQPRSIDDRPYRGLNAVVLALTAATNGWPSGTWATYRGWQRHGAQVRRGERATHVLLWKPTRPATERDDSTNEPDDSGTSTSPRGRLVSRVFAVFAAEQVDGADSTLTDRDEPRDTPERIAAADTYFASIGANVINGGNRACYIPADDRIHVPHLSQFMSMFIGQPTPAGSPATSPADSETTPTRSKNSSPNSAQRSGAHSQRSRRPRATTTPATSRTGCGSSGNTRECCSPSPPAHKPRSTTSTNSPA